MRAHRLRERRGPPAAGATAEQLPRARRGDFTFAARSAFPYDGPIGRGHGPRPERQGRTRHPQRHRRDDGPDGRRVCSSLAAHPRGRVPRGQSDVADGDADGMAFDESRRVSRVLDGRGSARRQNARARAPGRTRAGAGRRAPPGTRRAPRSESPRGPGLDRRRRRRGRCAPTARVRGDGGAPLRATSRRPPGRDRGDGRARAPRGGRPPRGRSRRRRAGARGRAARGRSAVPRPSGGRPWRAVDESGEYPPRGRRRVEPVGGARRRRSARAGGHARRCSRRSRRCGSSSRGVRHGPRRHDADGPRRGGPTRFARPRGDRRGRGPLRRGGARERHPIVSEPHGAHGAGRRPRHRASLATFRSVVSTRRPRPRGRPRRRCRFPESAARCAGARASPRSAPTTRARRGRWSSGAGRRRVRGARWPDDAGVGSGLRGSRCRGGAGRNASPGRVRRRVRAHDRHPEIAQNRRTASSRRCTGRSEHAGRRSWSAPSALFVSSSPCEDAAKRGSRTARLAATLSAASGGSGPRTSNVPRGRRADPRRRAAGPAGVARVVRVMRAHGRRLGAGVGGVPAAQPRPLDAALRADVAAAARARPSSALLRHADNEGPQLGAGDYTASTRGVPGVAVRCLRYRAHRAAGSPRRRGVARARARPAARAQTRQAGYDRRGARSRRTTSSGASRTPRPSTSARSRKGAGDDPRNKAQPANNQYRAKVSAGRRRLLRGLPHARGELCRVRWSRESRGRALYCDARGRDPGGAGPLARTDREPRNCRLAWTAVPGALPAEPRRKGGPRGPPRKVPPRPGRHGGEGSEARPAPPDGRRSAEGRDLPAKPNLGECDPPRGGGPTGSATAPTRSCTSRRPRAPARAGRGRGDAGGGRGWGARATWACRRAPTLFVEASEAAGPRARQVPERIARPAGRRRSGRAAAASAAN